MIQEERTKAVSICAKGIGKPKKVIEQEICKIFTTLSNEVQTKTGRSYLPEILEEIIKINLRCLAMNHKDGIFIDKAFHRMKYLSFSLWDTEDKEGNPITRIIKFQESQS
jgi:mannosyltransferase OCH1-like enzyme